MVLSRCLARKQQTLPGDSPVILRGKLFYTSFYSIFALRIKYEYLLCVLQVSRPRTAEVTRCFARNSARESILFSEYFGRTNTLTAPQHHLVVIMQRHLNTSSAAGPVCELVSQTQNRCKCKRVKAWITNSSGPCARPQRLASRHTQNNIITASLAL